MNNDSKLLLEVKEYQKHFVLKKNLFGKPLQTLKAVDNVNFKLEAGKTIGVVGESGCGKTTLGRTILQLYDTTGGRALYYGHTLEEFLPKYYVKDVVNLDKNIALIKTLANELKSLYKEELTQYESVFSLNINITLNDYNVAINAIKQMRDSIEDNSENKEKISYYNNVIKSLSKFVNLLDATSRTAGATALKKILNDEALENSELFKDLEANKETGLDLARLTKKELRSLRTEIQLIFQDPYSSLPPRMTVGAILSEAVKVHNIVPKNEVNKHVREIMRKCGLQPQYYDRYPHEFSGGQRQRICIARALAVNPKLVICDEPVSALDVSIQAQIINLLKDLQRELGLTYMFISHDLSVVKYITDNIIVMYLGNMMEIGDTDDIFKNPLHPYTKALFSAVPNPDPDSKMERIVLEGDIPSAANPPKGCKFHTRCSECMSVCKLKVPQMIECESNHVVACHLYDSQVMADLEKYDKELEEFEKLEAERLANIKQKNKFQKFIDKLIK